MAPLAPCLPRSTYPALYGNYPERPNYWERLRIYLYSLIDKPKWSKTCVNLVLTNGVMKGRLEQSVQFSVLLYVSHRFRNVLGLAPIANQDRKGVLRDETLGLTRTSH